VGCENDDNGVPSPDTCSQHMSNQRLTLAHPESSPGECSAFLIHNTLVVCLHDVGAERDTAWKGCPSNSAQSRK
jgi:hypothetical protein